MANRLANATSPYLQQHAGNPVDWWEWGSEAFAEAKRRDAPILLSVGYAACHWCHVMAHESFEDAATAQFMNDHFVSIKVDREERPDVDAVYMQATTAMTGSGGWPMTCVLDHDGNPFFCGTYFPERPRHGQPAFTQVLQALSAAWTDQPEEIARVAGNVRAHLERGALRAAPPLTDDDLRHAVTRLGEEYDDINSGFGGAPKFPPSMVLEFLAREAARTGDPEPRRMVEGTLAAMAISGTYDQIGGGFARYAVDAGWVVPHFEKMLYDNAQLLDRYARWDTDLGREVTARTADWMIRDLGTDEGAFASSLDADSLDEQGKMHEGAYYVWTPEQVRACGGSPEDLGVTQAGTFEHGTSTLRRLAPLPEHVRVALLAERDRRTAPARDDKVVAAWNGLAITGLITASRTLDRDDLLAAAIRCAEFVWATHMVDGRLRRVSRDGVVGDADGVLEDYGCLATSFVALAGATADPVWLERAETLVTLAKAEFHTPDGWYDARVDADLPTRPRDPADNASPSGLSSIAHALIDLAAMTGNHAHRELAEETITSVSALVRQAPRFAGWAAAAAVALADGPIEIALIGRDRELRKAAALRPGAIIAETVEPTNSLALLENRPLQGGRPTVYVCRGFTCQQPVNDVAALRDQLGD